MTIDTEIRHVTKAGANLFLELGFSAAEAKQLRAASRKSLVRSAAMAQRHGDSLGADHRRVLEAIQDNADPASQP